MLVMTFNIRFENEQDGQNGWLYRRDLVVQLIDRYEPLVLGTQEGKWSQLLYLRDHLPRYHMHAPDRIEDETSQYPTLFFFRGQCELLDGGECWLSKTPQVHRSKDWDSAFPRMMSYARLGAQEKGRTFWIAVTHLDHIGKEARLQQAKILAGWAESRNEPVMLMGDFNDDPGSRVHQVLTAPETGLFDTWQSLNGAEGPESFTHHAFNGSPQKSRMDWILAGPQFHVTEARIIKDHFEGRYPSDHFPYVADLEWA